MDLEVEAGFTRMLDESISLRMSDCIDGVHRVRAIGTARADKSGMERALIRLGVVFAPRNVVVELPKLHEQESRLNGVKARVTADLIAVISIS